MGTQVTPEAEATRTVTGPTESAEESYWVRIRSDR
jgi:hypothetical protein